jgi:tripartite-type tricarboxylate transporter receptor subunit TctC
VLGFVDSGKLRPLAVTTKSRIAKLPNVPAVAEVLPGFEIVLWNGIFVPTGTPKDIVQKLGNAVQTVLQDPAVLKKLAEQGSTPLKSNPDDFKKVIVKWGDLIKMAGARVD